jgi:hypothetical protein
MKREAMQSVIALKLKLTQLRPIFSGLCMFRLLSRIYWRIWLLLSLLRLLFFVFYFDITFGVAATPASPTMRRKTVKT